MSTSTTLKEKSAQMTSAPFSEPRSSLALSLHHIMLVPIQDQKEQTCLDLQEPIELRFMKPEQAPYSVHNALTRLAITTAYVVIVSIQTANTAEHLTAD